MSLDLLEPWGARILAAILLGGLFALLVELLVRALPALSPATRSWLWWLVAARTLAELAGAPALELAWLPAQAPTELRLPSPGIPASAAAGLVPGLAASKNFRAVAEPGASPTGNSEPTSTARPESMPLRLLSLLWTSLAALATLRVGVEAHRLRSRLRRARPLRDGPEVEQLERLRHELAVGTPVRLAVSAEAPTPYVAGFWRPTIVLPESPRLTADELEMALAHELAHVRRRDSLRALVPLAAERLFLFHPLVRWAACEYALATEAACDAVVLARVARRPESYGRLLLRLATATSSDLPASAWPLARRPLERRLDMLTRHDSPRRLALAGLFGAGALTLLLALPVRLVAAAAPDFGEAPVALEAIAFDAPAPAAPVAAVVPVAPVAPVASTSAAAPRAPRAPRTLAAPLPALAPLAPLAPTTPMPTLAPTAPTAPMLPVEPRSDRIELELSQVHEQAARAAELALQTAALAHGAAERAMATSELAREQAARRIEAEMQRLAARMAELAESLERNRSAIAADQERIGRVVRDQERRIQRQVERDVERSRRELERQRRLAIEGSHGREVAEPVQ